MRVRHLKPADYRAMPWKNGGGQTLEIALGPEGAGVEDFLWRLSIAQVAESGPFSAFPGVDRTLTVLKGDGLKLDFEEGADLVVDVPWQPASFDGGRACRCRLIGGAVEDFNVMTRRGRATHRVRALRLDDEELIEALEKEVTAVLVTAGQVEAQVHGQALRMAPRELLLVEREPAERCTWELRGEPHSNALLVEIDFSVTKAKRA
jgi:environmental stress-induced protein Ves